MENSLTKQNLYRILRGALIAGGAAILYYILEAASALDYGAYTPLVTALLSVAINVLRVYRRA